MSFFRSGVPQGKSEHIPVFLQESLTVLNPDIGFQNTKYEQSFFVTPAALTRVLLRHKLLGPWSFKEGFKIQLWVQPTQKLANKSY